MNEQDSLDPRLLNEPEGESPGAKLIASARISFWFIWLFWFIVLYILAVTIGPSVIHLGLGIPLAFIVSALVAMVGGLFLALVTAFLRGRRLRWTD